MTYKPLEDYFNNLYNEPLVDGYPIQSGLPVFKINMKDKTMAFTYPYPDDSTNYEEPLTSVYFQISTPAVAQYPKHEHTVRLEWQEGARWHDVLWEVTKVLEAQYGYEIKSKIFFQVHELMVEAEDSHGDPELAKQMFTKDLS